MEIRSSVTPRSLRRLHWMLIPGPIVSRLQVQCDEHWRQLDLGSVSTGYSDRPVARAIKIKHAGLNLTGPERKKLQASSCKLDNRSGIV